RLLLGETPDVRQAELRARNQQQTDLAQLAATQMLTSPISSSVNRVFGDLPGAPTVMVAPLLANELNPTTTARVTVGQRISSRAYLSYTKTLSQPEPFILLEYEQSDRLSWLLSRNEDSTYALDFRIRHVF